MEVHTLKNVVILGLVQVGVIVAGVLGAGAVHKVYTTGHLTVPASTDLMTRYGALALVVPLVWTAYALHSLRRDDPAEEPRLLAFFSGVAVLVLLLALVVCTSVSPFVRLFCSCTLGLSA